MFMRPRAADAPEPQRIGRFTSVVIGATVALILVIGFAPTQLLRGVSRSTLTPVAAVRGSAPLGAVIPAATR
jgi:hypothetical protein